MEAEGGCDVDVQYFDVVSLSLSEKILYIDCTVHLYCTCDSGSGSDGVNGCVWLLGGGH